MELSKNSLIKNTLNGWRHKHWTSLEALAYLLKGVSRELNISPDYFLRYYNDVSGRVFSKKWLNKTGKTSYFDIKGAKMPDISNDKAKMTGLIYVFDDTFRVPVYFNDNYDKSIVDIIDKNMTEGPYGYSDGAFDVTVKKGDVVLDVGAWIGDFSAYAASKGAVAYAFEPVTELFELLGETAELNNHKIYPVKKGLSNKPCDIDIAISGKGSIGNSFVMDKIHTTTERISLTTLDDFVTEEKLTSVDFIKADIEGAERDMLRGATNVLEAFAPKLAICTYHFPDDPEVLEKIILDANPNYTVVQLRHKLMAAVVK